MNNVYNLRKIIRIKEPDFLWILEYNMMITRTLVTIINITLKLVAIIIDSVCYHSQHHIHTSHNIQ